VRDPILRELAAARARHDVELRTLIVRAVRAGAPSQDIAAALGVSRATLWRRYRAQLWRSRDPTGPRSD
jgi:AcrR family transcriptional regulator